MGHDTPRSDDQGDLDPNDQRLFNEGRNTLTEPTERQDPANANDARDERDLGEEAETLANNIIGQSATPDGTKRATPGKTSVISRFSSRQSCHVADAARRCSHCRGFWLLYMLAAIDICGHCPSPGDSPLPSAMICPG